MDIRNLVDLVAQFACSSSGSKSGKITPALKDQEFSVNGVMYGVALVKQNHQYRKLKKSDEA